MDWASTEFVKFDQADRSAGLNGEPRVGVFGRRHYLMPILPSSTAKVLLSGLYSLYTMRYIMNPDSWICSAVSECQCAARLM